MTNAALRGKPDAGNPHVRFDEGEVASAATPRRGSLLYKQRLSAFFAVACLLCVPAYADEWFVSPNGSDSAAGTEVAPFRTLTNAVFRASANDTITLLPGDHVEGVTTQAASQNRVVVDKPLIIRSRDGRDATRIVGAWSTVESTSLPWGMGAGSVRCVWIAAAGSGTRLEGITFANGSTPTTTGSAATTGTSGGGLYVDSAASATVVNCAFVDCEGTNGGGLFYGNQNDNVKVVRTLFKRCRSTKFGYAMRGGAAYNCVFDDNGRTRLKDGTLKTEDNTLRGALCVAYVVVNCTFVGNDCYGLGGDTKIPGVYNCLFVKNGTGSADVRDMNTAYVTGYYNCVSDVSSTTANNSEYVPFDSSAEVYSPADGDYRLVYGAHSLTNGNATFLTQIPEEFRDKDFYGNARTTDGVVYVGAVQRFATAVASGVLLRLQGNGSWRIGGKDFPLVSCTWKVGEGWPAPVLVQFAPTSGVALVRYTVNGEPVWPRRDDAAWVNSQTPGAIRAVTPVTTTNVVWADANEGSDETGDGSAAAPFKTLGMAVTNSLTTHVVYAKAGDYNAGGSKAIGQNSRVVVPGTFSGELRVLAVEGPDVTFISGTYGTTDATYGFGADGARCVAIASTGANYAAIQGFTLRNGRTATSNGKEGNGAALANIDDSSVSLGTGLLVDCVITNCLAPRGAAAFGGTLLRCRVYDCLSTGNNNGILRGGNAISTLFAGCGKKSGITLNVVAGASYAWNCTFYGNSIGSFYESGTAGLQSGLCNCVSAARTDNGNDLDRASAFSAGWITNTLYQRAAAGATANFDETVVSENPVEFADEALGYLALSKESAGYSLASATQMKSCMDIDGNPFEFAADGAYQAGCYAPRPKTELSTWYVDSANGNDANDGKTEESAFATLAAAISAAEYGDTVVALPGTYASGTMLQNLAQSGGSVEPTLPARVVVKSGVTLESRDGAEATVIRGEASSAQEAVNGCGEGAVRGVFLCRDATVRGFTITGGHTLCTGVTSVNEYGGAVAGCAGAAATDAEFSGLVENCVISGNVARIHNSQYGTYRNCRFVGNVNAENKMGFAVSRARLEGCYFEGNGASTSHSTIYCSALVNCTVRGGQAGAGSGNGTVCNEGDYVNVRAILNSVIEAERVKVSIATNCLFGVTTTNLYSGTFRTNAMVYAAANLNDFGIPLAGSPAVDAGDNALASAELTAGCDGAGVRRVLNAVIDLGAYEYDWGAPWGRAIGGGRRLAIVDMPSSAAIVGNRLVFVDGTVKMIWNRGGAGDMYSYRVNVTGSGALAVVVDGETVGTFTALDGARELRFSSNLPAHALSFTYVPGADDVGGAEMYGFVHVSGIQIIVR